MTYPYVCDTCGTPQITGNNAKRCKQWRNRKLMIGRCKGGLTRVSVDEYNRRLGVKYRGLFPRLARATWRQYFSQPE